MKGDKERREERKRQGRWVEDTMVTLVTFLIEVMDSVTICGLRRRNFVSGTSQLAAGGGFRLVRRATLDLCLDFLGNATLHLKQYQVLYNGKNTTCRL